MSMMLVPFHGGPLDGQRRRVWEANGIPFSFRHVYTRARDVALHWAYRWQDDHYECTIMEPMVDKHDSKEQPMFDDLHDYEDGTDDYPEGTATSQAPA